MSAPVARQAAVALHSIPNIPNIEESAVERQNERTPQIDETVIAEALRSSLGTARGVIADLEDAGFLIMRKPRGDLVAISEAVRTGNWTPVTEWDWKAWLAAVHAGFITKDTVMSWGEDAIAKLARTVPLTQEAVSAAVDALDREEEPTTLGIVQDLLRRGRQDMIEVAAMLSGLLSGGEVHTGRVIEVRYRDDDGDERTVRHKEYVKLGGVFYDPPAEPGISEMLAARIKASA